MTDLKQIEERANKATPGPWMWDISTANQYAMLETAHSGRYYVMGFRRWGMSGACPEFQVYQTYDGPLKERGSLGMVRADELAKSYPGKEHHIGFDDYIDHPDADFIAHAREDIPFLLAELEKIKKEKERWLRSYREDQEELAAYRAKGPADS